MDFSTHHSEFESPIPDPQKYIENAFEIYEKTKHKQKGKVLFLVGNLGSGKTEVLSAMIKSFNECSDKPTVIAGSLSNGTYQPFIVGKNISLAEISDVGGNLLSSLAKVVSPRTAAFFDFIGQFLQLKATTIEFINNHLSKSSDSSVTPYLLKEIIRDAAHNNPLIFIIDDFDKAHETFLWNNFLLELAEEIAVDLPILVIASVTGNPNVGIHHTNETNTEFLTRELVHRNLAEWEYINPMTEKDIIDWIGLDVDLNIIQQLQEISGGNARWIRNLWSDWRLAGTVKFNEKRRKWEWATDKEPELNICKDALEGLIKNLLDSDQTDEIIEAKNILATAALEGVIFTIESLALTLNRDVDELIDYLDNYFVKDEENLNGILIEEGFLTLNISPYETRNVFRYRFASDWHWRVLERYVFSKEVKQKILSELIYALQIVYDSQDILVARSLANLCTLLGQDEMANHYQNKADYSLRQETMYNLAGAVLKIYTNDWDRIICVQFTKFLLRAGTLMLGTYSYSEVLKVFEKAFELALQASNEILQIDCFYYLAHIKRKLGNIDDAEIDAVNSLKLANKTTYKLGKARSLQLLSGICFDKDEYGKAEQYALESLKINKQIGLQEGVDVLQQMLGDIAFRKGNLNEARDIALQALKNNEKRGDDRGVVMALRLLSDIALTQSNYDEAIILCERSLKIEEEKNNLDGVSNTLHRLADLYFRKGETDKTEEICQRVFEIDEQLDEKEGMALALHLLAYVAIEKGDLEDAKLKVENSLELKQEIKSADGISTSLQLLSDIAFKHGNFNEAEEKTKKSLEIRRKIGAKGRIPFGLFKLANIYYEKRELEKAMENILECLAICEELQNKELTGKALHLISAILFLQGDKQNALGFLEKSVEVHNKIGSIDTFEVTKHLEILRSIIKSE